MDIRFTKCSFSTFGGTIAARDETHALRGSSKLECDGATGRASADHAHPNRAPSRLAVLQHCIDGHVVSFVGRPMRSSRDCRCLRDEAYLAENAATAASCD